MRLALLALAAIPLSAHDWAIVPGERVGPVTARSTEADVRAAFGADAVVSGMISVGPGAVAPGVEIYRGRINESLAVVWPRKDGDLWWPLTVIPCYGTASPDCRWRTASGVRVGATLADIQAINGRPFRLAPSLPLHAWTEPRWQKGRLEELGDDIDLAFEGAGEQFYAGAIYVDTNHEPLQQGVRRLMRMSVYLLASGRTAPPNDWIVGNRFWKTIVTAPLEPLRETFGPKMVRRSTEQADEGLGDEPAIVIFDGQADAEVRRRLGEDGSIFTCGGQKGCRWRLQGGLPWKMTLAKAVRRNGGPFVFNGFAFDLGGIITSWEGGRLKALLDGAMVAVDCEGDLPRRMIGEVQLKSNDPELSKFKCSVSVLAF
ncbi:MAG TPA: hypothetical protein VKU19_08945 [Bryobacteraceae bacterium]|nr:hypothetical protein [Bryobacteraceae bacterium]